ncbi:MAG: hypothetical protein RIG61_12970 [Deltaproteobacteria bacterium]
MERETKTDKLVLRVTPTEKAEIEKIAEEEGLSVSDYLRLSMMLNMTLFGPDGTWRKITQSNSHELGSKLQHKLLTIKGD